jgi:hypothetical protein
MLWLVIGIVAILLEEFARAFLKRFGELSAEAAFSAVAARLRKSQQRRQR